MSKASVEERRELVLLARAVDGVADFASEGEIKAAVDFYENTGRMPVRDAAVRAASTYARGAVIGYTAELIGEELAAAGLTATAAAVVGAEAGMILGPAGLAAGAVIGAGTVGAAVAVEAVGGALAAAEAGAVGVAAVGEGAALAYGAIVACIVQ